MQKNTKGLYPGPKSPRVQAWIYEVINPILEDALPIELAFLERGNLTWRFSLQKCEFVHSIKLYLNPSMWPNYEDFCAKQKRMATEFKKHDETLGVLSDKAKEQFELLRNSLGFKKYVEELLNNWIQSKAPASYPGGAYPNERFYLLMAENVVNNIQELPSHYADSEFWARSGKDIRLCASQELPLAGASRKSAEPRYGHQDLIELDLSLTRQLRELRTKLCDKYDLPAARTGYIDSHGNG